MKKTFAILIFMALFLLSSAAAAFAQKLPGFEGGIMDEVKYSEMVFITGKPVLLEGSVDISRGAARNGRRQDRLSYNLASSDGSVKLSRSITLLITMTTGEGKKQVKTSYEIVRASETINVKKGRTTDRYILKNYTFTASSISDFSAAVDYTTTVIRGKKVYDLNSGKGTVEVEISGKGAGYGSAWGFAETREIEFIISSHRKADEKNNVQEVSWTGVVEERLSSSQKVEVSYVENRPTLMSFEGAYIKTVFEDATARYDYTLPQFDENGMPLKRQNRGSETISLSSTPKVETGYIPEFYDIKSHWARQDVERLAALGIIKQEGNYYWPQVPARRLDFALALGRLLDVSSRAENLIDYRAGKNMEFDDLSLDEEESKIVSALTRMGVVEGTSPKRFSPDQVLTRAQVVTMLVRALGLEKTAPLAYRLGFRDEGEIPDWARDSVYIGSSIGLVKGDERGYFRPHDPVTRAEAAVFLNRFINYLKEDLERDFREKTMYY
ncbi:S-layer homology domain-containing protein [Thermovorax subterraneus]|nr:S-layer homology domain-containing protein [Thermovorax subterraneus]